MKLSTKVIATSLLTAIAAVTLTIFITDSSKTESSAKHSDSEPTKTRANVITGSNEGHRNQSATETVHESLSPSSVPGRDVQVESLVLAGNAVDAAAADRLLGSKDFDAVLENLVRHGEADGLEISRIYAETLGKAWSKSDSSFNIEKLACGKSLCGAVFSGDADQNRFNDLMDSANATGAKLHSAVVYPIKGAQPGDPMTYRVLFATDPSVNAITVDMTPPIRR